MPYIAPYRLDFQADTLEEARHTVSERWKGCLMVEIEYAKKTTASKQVAKKVTRSMMDSDPRATRKGYACRYVQDGVPRWTFLLRDTLLENERIR